MVKIRSSLDADKRAFKTEIQKQQSAQAAFEGDAVSNADTDDATLAPGLAGVEGINDEATDEEVDRGEFTKVTRLVYDEYDPSEP